MQKNQITAIVAAAIIVIAAAAAIVLTSERSSDEGQISIVDGSGQTITLDEPLTNVAVINSNVPRAMIMLGLDDTISCYYYGNNTFGIAAEQAYEAGDTNRRLGTYYTPSIEVLIDYGVQAVICPVSSMTLYSSVERACEQNGIQVIRLDCNGDTLLDDLQKLSTVFGNPESATQTLDDYMADYNATLQAVAEALEGTELYDYLCTFDSRNSIYNATSAMADLLSHAFANNVTSYTDLPTDSVTNTVNDGAVEAISEVMDRIGVYLMRATNGALDDGGADAEAAADNEYNSYVGSPNSNLLVTTDSPAYQNNQVYVIESEIMSGLYAHIGLVIIVSVVYDVQVEGYEDISAAISEFQEKYNQSSLEDGHPLVYRYGADYPADGDNLVLSYAA